MIESSHELKSGHCDSWATLWVAARGTQRDIGRVEGTGRAVWNSRWPRVGAVKDQSDERDESDASNSPSPIADSQVGGWELEERVTLNRGGVPLAFVPFVFHGPRHSRPEPDRLPLVDIIAANLDHYRLVS